MHPIKDYNQTLQRIVKLAVKLGADPKIAEDDVNKILQFDIKLSEVSFC